MLCAQHRHRARPAKLTWWVQRGRAAEPLGWCGDTPSSALAPLGSAPKPRIPVDLGKLRRLENHEPHRRSQSPPDAFKTSLVSPCDTSPRAVSEARGCCSAPSFAHCKGNDEASGRNGGSHPSRQPNRSHAAPNKVPSQGSLWAHAPSINHFARVRSPGNAGFSGKLVTHQPAPLQQAQKRLYSTFPGGETEAREPACAQGGVWWSWLLEDPGNSCSAPPWALLLRTVRRPAPGSVLGIIHPSQGLLLISQGSLIHRRDRSL